MARNNPPPMQDSILDGPRGRHVTLGVLGAVHPPRCGGPGKPEVKRRCAMSRSGACGSPVRTFEKRPSRSRLSPSGLGMNPKRLSAGRSSGCSAYRLEAFAASIRPRRLPGQASVAAATPPSSPCPTTSARRPFGRRGTPRDTPGMRRPQPGYRPRSEISGAP